jgi:hypothetical protein
MTNVRGRSVAVKNRLFITRLFFLGGNPAFFISRTFPLDFFPTYLLFFPRKIKKYLLRKRMKGEKQPLNSAYRYGDGSETDDYLSKITGSEVRRPVRHDDVSSAASSPRWTPATTHFTSRVFMALFSLVFLAGGIVTIVVFCMKEKYLMNLWPIVFAIGICFSLLFILAGFAGLGGGCCGTDIVRRASLFLFTVGTIGTIVGFAFITELKNGNQDDALLRNWKEAVQDDPNRVCNIQDDLSCSGWNALCNEFWVFTPAPVNSTPEPTTAAPVNTTAPADVTYCAMCTNNGLANITCYTAFRNKVTDDYPFFGVAVGSAVVANIIIAFVVYRTRGEEPRPVMTRV